MAITTVRTRALAIPVSRATRMSTRVLDQRHYVIVEISTNAGGPIGLGYVYAGTSGGRLVANAVDDVLAPVLDGADERDILGLWDRMYQETLLSGRRGAVLRALSAVDIALWDLLAKNSNVPLAVLLGGTTTHPVPAYASGGYYRPDEGGWCEAVTKEIQFNQSLGFRDHKIKVGGLPVPEDAERVAAAIEAIGGRGRLALDANNAYKTTAEALHASRAFERAAGTTGLWWIEEPLSPDDIAGHAALARELETIVATGEIHQTRWEFRDLIERQAADVLQPDVGVVGGVSEWIRVARTAETFGIPVAPHWHANLHVHLAAAAPNTLTVEHFALDKDIYNFERLMKPETRLSLKDGNLVVPDRPGHGIELNQELVGSYEITA